MRESRSLCASSALHLHLQYLFDLKEAAMITGAGLVEASCEFHTLTSSAPLRKQAIKQTDRQTDRLTDRQTLRHP